MPETFCVFIMVLPNLPRNRASHCRQTLTHKPLNLVPGFLPKNSGSASDGYLRCSRPCRPPKATPELSSTVRSRRGATLIQLLSLATKKSLSWLFFHSFSGDLILCYRLTHPSMAFPCLQRKITNSRHSHFYFLVKQNGAHSQLQNYPSYDRRSVSPAFSYLCGAGPPEAPAHSMRG